MAPAIGALAAGMTWSGLADAVLGLAGPATLRR
jgi:hypothetical protein